MHIGILTTGAKDEERRLVEAAEKRGHTIELLKVLKCSIAVSTQNSKVYHEGKDISDTYDIIIPRINIGQTQYGLAVLRQFQAMGIYTTDLALPIELGRDKLRCKQYLVKKGVPIPDTGFAYSKNDFETIINTVGGAPLILKLSEGTEGTGVFLAKDEKEAKNILNTLKQFDARVIVQKFIEESSGTDFRCFVVGDKIVATMRRESQDGDFRANIALGGKSYNETITAEEERIVLESARAIGINIAGVDMILSNSGPLIIEINVAPDFSGEFGLEYTSGVDVAGAIIDYAIEGKQKFDKGEGHWLEPKRHWTEFLLLKRKPASQVA